MEQRRGEPRATVPCPGCGGRGRFEWGKNDKVPRRWSGEAVCGMCAGRGVVPASWGKKRDRT